MLTQEERELLKQFVGDAKVDISPEQADVALEALGKVRGRVSHFQKTWKVQCDGLGALSTINEKSALDRFDEWADKVQGMADKNKKAPEVTLFESCKGEDTPLKKYVAVKPKV